QYFKPAGIEQLIEVCRTEIVKMPRHVDSVPGGAEQQELPASGVRNLQDQPPPGTEQFAGRVQIRARAVHVLEHMEHRNGGAAPGAERSLRQHPCRGWSVVYGPGGARRIR